MVLKSVKVGSFEISQCQISLPARRKQCILTSRKGWQKEKATHFPKTWKNISNDEFDSLRALLFPSSFKCLEKNNSTRISATSASKVIRLIQSSLQWWFIRRDTLFPSLYCDKDRFVYKYSSLITWHTLIDRKNTLLGSISHVENHFLEGRASSDQPWKRHSLQLACSHLCPSFVLWPLPALPTALIFLY